MDAYADDELAALYDLFFAADDADLLMHEQFARRGAGPSLDLGAGSGRLALHLARAGLDVVALDRSPAMLARLRGALDERTAPRVRVIEGDMRAFDLGGRFDVIHCAANTFQHLLTTEDQLAALRRVAAHLTPGGVFVARVRALASVDWHAEPSVLRLRAVRTDPETGDTVSRFESWSASLNEQVTAATWIFDRVDAHGNVRRRSFDVTLRLTGQHELRLLLERAGLRLLHIYGDVDLSPFDDASDSMVFVAGLEG
jgi:SAM-dependent methyltransferase